MSDDRTIAVKARGLSKTYGAGTTEVSALSDATFDIPAGEFVVLLGPSGSGKTTLLNLVGALESPTAGEVEVLGTPLAGSRAIAQRTAYRLHTVGFVFQFFNLVPTLTAAENVALLAELTGPDAQKRTADVLERVGLARPHEPLPRRAFRRRAAASLDRSRAREGLAAAAVRRTHRRARHRDRRPACLPRSTTRRARSGGRWWSSLTTR